MRKLFRVAKSGEILFFMGLMIVSLVLTFQTHRKTGNFNWRSEIWADRAGYYIYLPSFFMYHFDATKCPEKIDEKTGFGFTVDYRKNTINTKYSYGVAALLSPFFIGAYIVSPVLKVPGEAGFGVVYHKMVNVAAVVYLILGLWLLKQFLAYYFKPSLQYFILFFIYTGTNLLFYAIDDTLMSHVYSFFLFSLFLLSLKKFLDDSTSYRYFVAMSVSFAFIVLIRPTNALILLLFFLWDVHDLNEIKNRIMVFLRFRHLASFVIVLFCIFLPQMIYWKYSTGNYLAYSYGNESFLNWKHPKLLEVWFSTLNGLFLYTPLVILIIAGMILMIVKKVPNGLLTLLIFIFISYIFASWYNWYFGCSFGQRSFVEYYAIFAIPFGYFIESSVRIRNLLIRSLVLLLIFLFSYYNVRMMLKFDKCFFGSTWDWGQFSRQLERASIFSFYKKDYTFDNDLENQALSYSFSISDSVHHSGMYCAKILPDKEYTPVFSVPMKDLGEKLPRYINFDFWALNPGSLQNEALVVCSIDKGDTNLVWQSQPLAPIFTQKLKWQKITNRFVIPDGLKRDPVIKLYIWNPKKSVFFVDDLNVVLE